MNQPQQQPKTGEASYEAFLAERQRMGRWNRHLIDRARAGGRDKVLQQEFRRDQSGGPMRRVTYVESMARIDERERLARGEADPRDNGRQWRQKYIADDGTVSYDAAAIRAFNARLKACEARRRPPRLSAQPKPRARQSHGGAARTRGSRRSSPSGGGGDSGDDPGESDPGGDSQPPAAGETAEKRCENCGRRFCKPGRTCERCRKREERERDAQAKLDAEPCEPLLAPTCRCAPKVGCVHDVDGQVQCLTCSRIRRLEGTL